MLHSHESLDRPGGFSRLNLLIPLRHRSFRLLWAGMTVSLLGDGIFLVAVAWQTYAISNHPSALAGVAVAAALPQVLFLLVGGAFCDRYPRKRLLLVADGLRGVALVFLAVVGWLGHIQLWHMWAAAFVIGFAASFAYPAFDAIVPELVPADVLHQANSLDQFLRPASLRLLGPALGGLIVSISGSPGAFAADAASFAFSAWCVAHLPAAPARGMEDDGKEPSVWREVGGGIGYVRSQVWLWGSFVAASLTYLLFLGPSEVLLPYLIRNMLHGSAASLGVILGVGGAGAVLAACVLAQRGQPRHPITFMYAAWVGATLVVAGYGLATAEWQLAAIAATSGALEAAGAVVWTTLKQRLVPHELLGRVSSIEWLAMSGLMPLSYVLTPLAASAFGVRLTFVLAGTVGAVVTGAFYFFPGMREHDRPHATRSPELAAASVPAVR